MRLSLSQRNKDGIVVKKIEAISPSSPQ